MQHTDTCHQAATELHNTDRHPLVRLWLHLLCWQDLANQRRELGNLDARSLRDIGVDRVDAQRESQRPFWDRPKR